MHKILDVPIHRMLEQLSREKAKELQAKEHVSQRKTKPKIVQDTLWVDRYRPVRFTELVGNERVARDIMGWIKQWEYCVFGKRSLKGKKRAREDEEVNMEDEFRRPKEKILLLSGPPGLGKTTMAHVLARQSGYEVMEVNASDARTAQDVDSRIRPALESGSSVGGSKPVLLVIDEIDGATGGGDNSSGFINKLISLTYDRPKRAQGSQAKKKPGGKRPLLRPIICICNDINAAVLSKLRSYTFQVRLQRPSDIHVVKRLKEVCELEKLTADGRALSALVGVAKGDLRGCINTLQASSLFIKSRNEDVTESVIRQATQGMKEGEADTSIMSVVTDIFAPMSKKRVKELGLTDSEESRYVGRLSRTIDSCGRDNSVAIGCFAHYPKLRKHDADFSRYLKADDWLVTFDLFSSAMYNAGEFALNQYLPYMLVPFYPLFQERGGPKIERDQADWETMQTTKANEEIYKSLGRGLQAASTRLGGAFRHFVYQPIMQLEFAPYINRIINPPLRPVNWQIIKAEERTVLQRLVAIMAALELRFVQERGEDGQLTYRLDPPVDVFITYDNKRAADIGASRYAVRHIVAEEVDTALAARSTEVVEKGKRGKHENLFGGYAVVPPPTTSGNGKPGEGPPRKRLKVPEIEDKPVLDFFGRPVVPKASTGVNPRGAAKSSSTKEKKFRVVYKFVEGNSAAVRKPVKIDTFM
ncbi:P-loop containing nucleoside triphosphate hydrolase protein [Cylindrobasidium torrendii FP15055 ss-10]|uniref:p-loop containing nucleoside triphosphate hydrolase protein n=1 Tax=Cylindrobasidium torrendii FP15055 ss-10 TaxID=1314674 RepID=A0A0D7BS55_9AGAR|nr:P-loop containing nucleoside triphosphate hydrolase protein [Cylindrobasidium torrendii FP15055 ss-10]